MKLKSFFLLALLTQACFATKLAPPLQPYWLNEGFGVQRFEDQFNLCFLSPCFYQSSFLYLNTEHGLTEPFLSTDIDTTPLYDTMKKNNHALMAYQPPQELLKNSANHALLASNDAPNNQPNVMSTDSSSGLPTNTTIHGFTPDFLAINLNHVDQAQPVVAYQDATGHLFFSADTLNAWGINVDKDRPIAISKELYYEWSTLSGASETIDSLNQKAFLILPPSHFLGTHVKVHTPDIIAPQKPPPGGFINYNVFSQSNTTNHFQTSGFFESGVFSPYGVGLSDFLATNDNPHNKFVRLNSSWNIDMPDRMESLRFGDNFNMPSMWGNSVDFGGIQWGTNFATQPELITFPLPTVGGNAILPSTAQIFLNNALIANEQVASGPFSLNDLPVTTGDGNLQMVVTDLTGKQQITTIPYYADSQVLKKGLSNYSVEAGFIRKNFARQSNDYGQALMSGTDMIGITNHLTLQGHAELRKNTQTVGLGESYKIDIIGTTLSSAAAVSHHRSLNGSLLQVGFNHANNHFNLGGKTTLTSQNYRALGYGENNTPPPKAQSQIFASMPLFPESKNSLLKSSSIGSTYISQINRGTANENIISANFSFKPASIVSSTLTALTDLNNHQNNAILLTTSINLGDHMTINTNASQNNDSRSLNTTLTHYPPPNSGGLGYSVGGSVGSARYASAGANYQYPYGFVSANAARDPSGNAYQLQASGGAVFIHNHLYATKNLSNSFALVDLHGIKDVPVHAGGNEIVFSNDAGYALLPNLLPYMKNKITIDPKKLSDNIQVNATHINVVPYAHSGVLVDFPIKRITSATLTLKQNNGQAVPAGAQLQIAGKKETSTVGYNGFTYFTNLKPSNYITATWYTHGEKQACHFTLNYHANTTTQEDLGTKRCDT